MGIQKVEQGPHHVSADVSRRRRRRCRRPPAPEADGEPPDPPEEDLSEGGAHEAVDEEVDAGVEGHETVGDGCEAHGHVGDPVAVVLDALNMVILLF